MNVRPFSALTLLVAAMLLPSHGWTQEESEPVEAPDAEWVVLGSFSGSSASGWLSRINNWIFEYESDDSLFQDLGDIGVGVGFHLDDFEFDWDTFFKRKVVRSHADLEPGQVVADDDLSRYRTLSRARTRLRIRWNYLPDFIGQIGLGVEVEGGYSLAIARSHQPKIASDRAFEPVTRTGTTKELKQFFRENELNKNSDLIDILFGSMAAVTNKAVGEIGERTADTEKAAIFFDGYAEPMTYLTVSNLPPDPVLFTSEDSPIQNGDAITFTAFAGFSPLRASARESGFLISLKRFRRFIRETTVLKESDTVLLVRVRKLLWNGQELIPIKFRPRVRILGIFKLAYTFFDIKRDAFHQTVSDITYRIDLENPVALDFFRELVREAPRVQRHPPPLTFDMRPGVETLRSEFRKGRTRDRVSRARFFSWIRFREGHITSVHDVQTADAEIEEVIRARIRELRMPFGRKRRFRSRSVITTQSDVESDLMHGGLESHEGERYATTIETSISAPRATGADVQSLGENLRMILDFSSPPEEFEPLIGLPKKALSGLTFDLLLSFGPEQAAQLETVSETQLWIVLAELLLGPQYRGAWSTPEQRFWWKPSDRSHGRASFMDRHISDHYDELRGYKANRKRSLGFSPDQFPSRQLFIKASKMVKKFKGIQREIREGDCLKCMANVFAKASDVVIFQALLVRFGGGVEFGDVGYQAEVFSNEMVSPAKVTNGVAYTYRHQQTDAILGDVELAREPPPRLRGGELVLHVVDPEADRTSRPDTPCWRLQLFSDLLFEPSMPLKLYLRKAKAGVDKEIMIATLDLGEPHLVPEAPFMASRYYYDIPVPWSGTLLEKEAYTLLMRVLNSEGLPVTEEQEIRLELPEGWPDLVPANCAPRSESVEFAALDTDLSQAASFEGTEPFSSPSSPR